MTRSNREFQPKTEILANGARGLWRALAEIPSHFVLYGETAIALHLGHSQGQGFRFLTAETFDAEELREQISFLSPQRDSEASIRIYEASTNKLAVTVDAGTWPVSVSFEGGLQSGQLALPSRCIDNHLAVASLEDLGAWSLIEFQRELGLTKDAVVPFSLTEILAEGLELGTLLGGASALAPDRFSPLNVLEVLRREDLYDRAYYDEAENQVDAYVAATARQVGIIPNVPLQSPQIGAEEPGRHYKTVTQPELSGPEMEL